LIEKRKSPGPEGEKERKNSQQIDTAKEKQLGGDD